MNNLPYMSESYIFYIDTVRDIVMHLQDNEILPVLDRDLLDFEQLVIDVHARNMVGHLGMDLHSYKKITDNYYRTGINTSYEVALSVEFQLRFFRLFKEVASRINGKLLDEGCYIPLLRHHVALSVNPVAVVHQKMFQYFDRDEPNTVNKTLSTEIGLVNALHILSRECSTFKDRMRDTRQECCDLLISKSLDTAVPLMIYRSNVTGRLDLVMESGAVKFICLGIVNEYPVDTDESFVASASVTTEGCLQLDYVHEFRGLQIEPLAEHNFNYHMNLRSIVALLIYRHVKIKVVVVTQNFDKYSRFQEQLEEGDQISVVFSGANKIKSLSLRHACSSVVKLKSVTDEEICFQAYDGDLVLSRKHVFFEKCPYIGNDYQIHSDPCYDGEEISYTYKCLELSPGVFRGHGSSLVDVTRMTKHLSQFKLYYENAVNFLNYNLGLKSYKTTFR
jgi:hypothetical protein